jgi:hypothetical protein
MTGHARVGIFSLFRQGLFGVAVGLSLFQLSGCSTSSMEETVPTAPPSGLSSGQARVTGTFPNLNIAPTVAAPQLSDAEKAAKLAELKAAQSSQSAVGEGGTVPNDEAVLKKLATSHAKKTLSEIESK